MRGLEYSRARIRWIDMLNGCRCKLYGLSGIEEVSTSMATYTRGTGTTFLSAYDHRSHIWCHGTIFKQDLGIPLLQKSEYCFRIASSPSSSSRVIKRPWKDSKSEDTSDDLPKQKPTKRAKLFDDSNGRE